MILTALSWAEFSCGARSWLPPGAIQTGKSIGSTVIREIESMVLAHARPDAELDELDASDRLDICLRVIAMLEQLPSFDIKAKDWAKQARESMAVLIGELADGTPLSIASRLRAPAGSGDKTLAEVAGQPGEVPSIQTTHSVKGESHGATLLIAVDEASMPSQNTTSWIG